jgi:Mg2+ and Co2+ transporter CorA
MHYTKRMVTRHTRGKVTWVDLESPTHEELSQVMREFNIDARIEEEIIAPTHYPLAIAFSKYHYLILHFPTSEPGLGTRNQEVDFIVGKNFIITARYEVIDTLHNLHRVFEAEELLGLPHNATHADELLERLMRRLYGAIREEMEHAARVLERIEQDMFSGKERDTVHEISNVGRVLLRFQTTLVRHEEPLGIFLQGLSAPAFFGKNFAKHIAHIEAERDHVADLVRSYRAAASELRATNDSLLNASQNEIMKRLTVLAFLGVPITVSASLFGMNVEGVPFIDNPNAFWIVTGIGLFTTCIIYIIFKARKWL